MSKLRLFQAGAGSSRHLEGADIESRALRPRNSVKIGGDPGVDSGVDRRAGGLRMEIQSAEAGEARIGALDSEIRRRGATTEPQIVAAGNQRLAGRGFTVRRVNEKP
jgi:hypothetical protein